jgi:hypothetical protein
MTDRPIIIKRSSQRAVKTQADVKFVPQFSDSNAVIKNYRQKAWSLYQATQLPIGTEEEWRRTSVKGVDFSGFTLVNSENYPAIEFPISLSAPVAGEKNGGQLLLSTVNSHLIVEPSIMEQ